ncbi:hypothetical protein HHK36_018922 [Tetracentron sinense]|uniref:Uncharacterized protein n=1 Tax=Tetracentron sinense TaxID=13715 RepID=A0A835D8P5_TETSI|nr:hypothetical protein HHK36_018922 [Tetracentron sinense]
MEEDEPVFDSSRSAAAGDGLFSDFEQSEQDEASGSLEKETVATESPQRQSPLLRRLFVLVFNEILAAFITDFLNTSISRVQLKFESGLLDLVKTRAKFFSACQILLGCAGVRPLEYDVHKEDPHRSPWIVAEAEGFGGFFLLFGLLWLISVIGFVRG